MSPPAFSGRNECERSCAPSNIAPPNAARTAQRAPSLPPELDAFALHRWGRALAHRGRIGYVASVTSMNARRGGNQLASGCVSKRSRGKLVPLWLAHADPESKAKRSGLRTHSAFTLIELL